MDEQRAVSRIMLTRLIHEGVSYLALQAEIDRIIAIWYECRARYGGAGPWLFGKFSIADAMFVPVVFRFRSYRVSLPAAAAG